MANLDFCMFCGCCIYGGYCPYCKKEQMVSFYCEREGCNNTPTIGESICNDCWESYYSRDIPGFGEDPTEGYEKEIDRGGEGLDPDDCLYGDMD